MRYFENLHPICILCYFVAVIGLTLTCFHPVMLLVSLLGALAFLIRLKGGRGAVRHLSFVIPMSLLVAIANPLINHRGVTLLGNVSEPVDHTGGHRLWHHSGSVTGGTDPVVRLLQRSHDQ